MFCMLEVWGTPAPTIEFYKGFKDLSMEGGRFKIWTDGATNQAILGVEGLKQEDEGAYRCVLNGEIEHEFSIYVTVEGGMDFRAMLMKRKKPAKKVVVVSSSCVVKRDAKFNAVEKKSQMMCTGKKSMLCKLLLKSRFPLTLNSSRNYSRIELLGARNKAFLAAAAAPRFAPPTVADGQNFSSLNDFSYFQSVCA